MKLYSILILFMFLSACTAMDKNIDESDENFEEKLSDLMETMDEKEVLDPTDWHNFFEITIPERMFEMEELNENAIAQFGYVEEVADDKGNKIVLENYLIVMMETKKEIATYPVQLNLDAMSYRNDVIESLRNGLDKSEILTKNPLVEKINGMDCVINELRGSVETYDGEVFLYYKLGVFESGKAFFQVLSWCIDSQKAEFELEMEKAIKSFKAK